LKGTTFTARLAALAGSSTAKLSSPMTLSHRPKTGSLGNTAFASACTPKFSTAKQQDHCAQHACNGLRHFKPSNCASLGFRVPDNLDRVSCEREQIDRGKTRASHGSHEAASLLGRNVAETRWPRWTRDYLNQAVT
jgi:hypothetical protein